MVFMVPFIIIRLNSNPQSNIFIESVENIIQMSKLQTTMSTLSYIDQMSLHIQDDRKIQSPVLFIYIYKNMPSNHISILKTKIQHKYRRNYSLQYYQSYRDILTLSLKTQPVSIIFVNFDNRSWAKKFCSNQQLSQRFRMFIVSTNQEEVDKTDKYNTKHLKMILFPNDIEQISTEICLLSQKSVLTVQNKLIYPTYFQHYSNQSLLTIYISSQLALGFQSQGKKILKNKNYQNVQIRQFKNIEQFISKLKNDINLRKKSKMQVDQLIIEQCQNKKLTQQQQAKLWKAKELQLRNLIFIESKNSHLNLLKQFIYEDDYRRWEIISINQSQSMCQRIPNHYADYPFPKEYVPELNQIIESQQLFIIINQNQKGIIQEIYHMNKINCNNKVVTFDNTKQLGQLLGSLQLKQNSYGILIIDTQDYKKYRNIIRSYIDSRYPILNLKILVIEPNRPANNQASSSSILGQENSQHNFYQNWLNSNFFSDQNKPLVQFVMQQRCAYFYPALCLQERKIVLLVNHQQTQMTTLAHQIAKKNQRRLSVQYWNGFEHIQYILSKLKQQEWGLIFIYQNELKNVANILNSQSQMIVVGNDYKKYSHRKILKQGTEQQIIQFFNLIPKQQTVSILQSNSSLMLYNDTQLSIQTLKRFDFDQNQVIANEQQNVISVRLPLNIESENTGILERKLIEKLKQKAIIKYYASTSQIRDMGNRWEQKTQYLIITDDFLEWTQEFAKTENKQRFQIILYTYDNIQILERLVTKPNFSRFKLITNRWSQIQSYITRSHELFLEEQQKLQIIVGQSDRRLQNEFQNSNLLPRTYFKYYDQTKQSSIRQVLKQISHKHLIFVIINQLNTPSINEQKIIDDIVKYNPPARTILVSGRKSNKPRTVASFKNIQQVGDWIKSIKVRGYTTTGSVKVNKLK